MFCLPMSFSFSVGGRGGAPRRGLHTGVVPFFSAFKFKPKIKSTLAVIIHNSSESISIQTDLSPRSRRSHHVIDGVSGDPQHGRQADDDTDALGPPWIHVVTVSHRNVLHHVKNKDALN